METDELESQVHDNGLDIDDLYTRLDNLEADFDLRLGELDTRLEEAINEIEGLKSALEDLDLAFRENFDLSPAKDGAEGKSDEGNNG